MDHNNNRDTGVKKGKTVAPRRAGAGPDPASKAVEKARLLEKALQIIYQTPEVRPEKVAAIKEALDQGTYEIDSRKLANLLIAELILNR